MRLYSWFVMCCSALNADDAMNIWVPLVQFANLRRQEGYENTCSEH